MMSMSMIHSINKINNKFYKHNKNVRLYSNIIMVNKPNEIFNFNSTKEFHKFVLVKLFIKAGVSLTSQSNINAVIGPYGINIINLQKKLEEKVNLFVLNIQIPIVLKIYDFDKYNFIVKLPDVSFFLKQLNEKGTLIPFLSNYLIYELVLKKKNDMNYHSTNHVSIYRNLVGTLKSKKIAIYSDELFNTIQ